MITTNSARVAILQATANGRQTMADGGSSGVMDSLPRVMHGLDCGRVLAAMGRCDSYVQDWLLAAYAAEGYPGAAQAMVRCQATLYMAYTRHRCVRSATAKMLTMAGAVMRDLSNRQLGAQPACVGWYAEAVGFKRANWERWAKARVVMERILDDWDRDGLAEVSTVLRREVAA